MNPAVHSETSPSPTSSSPRPSDSYVQSFARGLEVIGSFSAQHPTQTLSEVAQRTGLTRAGARRILLTLQTLGYVRAQGREFSLTARILDLGFAYLSSMPIWNLAEPVMYSLSEQVKESCSAAVLDAADVVYVMRVPTQKIMRLSIGVGSRLPAYCTSLGRVLLGDLSTEEIKLWLQQYPTPALTPHTLTDKQALLERIEHDRAQGWSLVNQELEEGLISMAVPITGRSSKVVAALNISGPANRTTPEKMQQDMLAPLQRAAQRISELIRSH